MAKYTYTIEVKYDSFYEIEAENKEIAIEKAIEYFQECEPNVEIISSDDNTFAFYDRETGEDFFVEAPSPIQAETIAKKYFEKPIYLGKISLAEAEALGYDTYS